MPFSNTEQISPIMDEIIRFNPKSILDVGCGLGLYGVLCRIHLDLYYDVEFYKKLEGAIRWQTQIDGIEGCKNYLPFIPCWAYDHVYAGDAKNILPTLPDNHYDLVLILAMIEHLTEDQGIKLIGQLKRVGRAIILSVPKHWQAQRIPGYPLETHRSHWTEQALRDAGFIRFLPHWGAWLAVYGIPSADSSKSHCL
jgi:SAM-dependent methyltransferase